jgi:hypothetical protein
MGKKALKQNLKRSPQPHLAYQRSHGNHQRQRQAGQQYEVHQGSPS